MARPCLDRNVKFKLLVRRLALPRPYVRGLLETMWDVAHECGNPVLGTPEDVEIAAEWPGEPGAFFAALRTVGLVDELPDGRWEIHDYWDHAPKYVKDRLYQEAKRKRTKLLINQLQQSELFEDEAKPSAPPSPTDGDESPNVGDSRRQSAIRRNKSYTPAPAPAPAPKLGGVPPNNPPPVAAGPATGGEEDSPTRGKNRAPKKALVTPAEFLEAWNAVPRFIGARTLDGGRAKHFRARATDPAWADRWRQALAKAATIPFCLGAGERGWIADVDWFLRPDTVTRILEGKYDRLARGPVPPPAQPLPSNVDRRRQQVAAVAGLPPPALSGRPDEKGVSP